jgi:UrcA family protein
MTAASLALSCVAATPALAADSGPEIVVEAPRSVPVPIPEARSEYTGATISVTTVKMPVLYGDLDLNSAKGADSLMSRVHWVAVAVCGQLDRLYPFNPDANCVKSAVVKVTPSARATIASVRATNQICGLLASLLALGADSCPPRELADIAAPISEAPALSGDAPAIVPPDKPR